MFSQSMYFIIPIVLITLYTINAVITFAPKIRRLFLAGTIILTVVLFCNSSFLYHSHYTNIPIAVSFILISVSGFLIVEKRRIYTVLLILMLIFSILYSANLNAPLYRGAMDGFANIVRLQMIYPFIFGYPLLAFLLRNSRINDISKGFLLIVTSVITFISGVCLSYGHDGFFADHSTSVFFASITLITFSAGSFLLMKKSLRKLLQSREKATKFCSPPNAVSAELQHRKSL